MRKWLLLLFDLFIVSISPFLSILIRDNFLLIWEKLYSVLPYTGICILVSCLVFIAANVHRSVWKYAGMPDYTLILKAVTVSVGITVCIVYITGLQHGFALSVPIIQWAVIITMMVAFRFVVRSVFGARFPNTNRMLYERENVLIVGLSDVTGIYLHWVRKIAWGKINVVGILDEIRPLKGRHVQSCQVIGEPVELAQILAKYRIHGVVINRIVITVPFDKLTPETQGILTYYETRGGLKFEYLDGTFGGSSDGNRESVDHLSALETDDKSCMPRLSSTYFSSNSYYPVLKRSGDILLSLLLLLLLSPLILFVALLVFLDRGYPVTFWQQRLGKGGRPFKLFKFRTMCNGIDGNGEIIPDESRISRLGRFLRRARLDEIPQLYNILIGEMSFVGPRPLLVADQPGTSGVRLLVRPGLTGWAQVNGGQSVSKEDKAVLDLWYLKNISPYLDLKIVILTIWMVIFGERLNRGVIQRAKLDLGVVEAADSILASRTGADRLLSRSSEQKVA